LSWWDLAALWMGNTPADANVYDAAIQLGIALFFKLIGVLFHDFLGFT